jgi:hypothetical protein
MRLIALAGLLLALPLAARAETLTYVGETTNHNSYWVNSRWDYVYQLHGLTSTSTLRQWGIVCPVRPVNIFASNGWTSAWYGSIPSSLPQVSALWGKPGVVWQRTTSTTNTLHFQTTLLNRPVVQLYDGGGLPDGDTAYSANPEPESLLLLGLAIPAAPLLRRRLARRQRPPV